MRRDDVTLLLFALATAMRDDFPASVQRTLAQRVAFRCSNPACEVATSGPHGEHDRSVNIGVAAHITAASPNGPRFKAQLTAEQRCAADNGIWLCQNCAKLVDNDVPTHSLQLLRMWKTRAEDKARHELGDRPARSAGINAAVVIQGNGAIQISGTNAVNLGPNAISINAGVTSSKEFNPSQHAQFGVRLIDGLVSSLHRTGWNCLTLWGSLQTINSHAEALGIETPFPPTDEEPVSPKWEQWLCYHHPTTKATTRVHVGAIHHGPAAVRSPFEPRPLEGPARRQFLEFCDALKEEMIFRSRVL
jgi:hypothetical protein